MQNSAQTTSLLQNLNKQSKFQNHQCYVKDTETTFIWKIKNFEMYCDQSGKPIESPEFGIYNWQNPKFHILLYPRGFNKKNSKYLSLCFIKSRSETENFRYSCKFGIVATTGNKICYEFKNSKLIQTERVAIFFQTEKFQSPEKDIFLPDGNLTIFCHVKVKNMSLIYDFDFKLVELTEIYEEIYKAGRYSDVVLHVGKKIFKAHKSMLQARFPNLLKDIDGNKCSISQIDSKTMKALLDYIYTGSLNMCEINLFQIRSSDYVLPPHLKCLLLQKQYKTEITTFFQKKAISFKWVISNFSSLDPNKSVQYQLIGDYKVKYTWFNIFLTLSIDSNYVNIAVNRISKECKRIICTIKSSAVSKTFDYTYDKDDKWIIQNVFTSDMLKSQISYAIFDKIHLCFEIVVSDGSKTDKLERSECLVTSDLKKHIAVDLISFNKGLLYLLNYPKYCDVVLISGEKRFHAHKFILTARSSLFRYMFEFDSNKNKNSEIVIDLLDSTVINDMLAYIYCNEVEFSSFEIRHVLNIYLATCMFNLPELQKECVSFL